jgi:hypothetical protein
VGGAGPRFAKRTPKPWASILWRNWEKSKADFISKLGTVLEEADESAYWIELLIDAGKVDAVTPANLLREANELVANAISSINTARRNFEQQE